MPNTSHSYKISDGLYLVRQPISKAQKTEAKPVEVLTNHVMVIDCSGSMYSESPKLREHIKSKLPKLMKEGDTLSVIAFSGRGECYVVIEGEPIATLKDLSDVNRQIDRWIRPMGLTGFKDPLEEASKLIAKLSKKNPNPFSLFFMSDGCDNQWSRQEILKAVEKLSPSLAAATFVEYGYYADRPLLTQMAEKAGGALIFSDNFTKYAPLVEAAITKKVVGAKKIDVKVEGDLVGGFAFALQDNEILTFSVENGATVTVPENLPEIVYLVPTGRGKGENKSQLSLQDIAGNLGGNYDGIVGGDDEKAIPSAYAAISLFAQRMNPDVVLALLKATADAALIDQFASCFGKPKYSEFQDATKAAAFDEKKRWTKGFDTNRVPRDDAFTVFDFLKLLQNDEENRVLLGHKAFQYNRIGRGRVDANTRLSDAEQAELEQLTEELGKVKKDLSKTKEINAKIAALTNKPEPLKFVEAQDGSGYTVDNLVYNEDRPNISIQIRKEGTVDLSSRLPEEFKGKGLGKVPETFSTFCFRNYAIVKDGMVNVSKLPTKLSDSTRKALEDAVKDGRLSKDFITTDQDGVSVAELGTLPVINRQMVQSVSAKALFEKQWDLTKLQAAQKVYNSYMKERFPGKKSEGFAALYGEEATKWLSEQGFTDYSGFNPKSVVAESTDVYMAKELVVKLKGYSSLPSLNDFKKQASKNKLNGPGELMKPFVEEVENFLLSDAYTKAANADEVFRTWLQGKQKDATKKVRQNLFEISQLKMSIVVGQKWFTEFKSLDENTMNLNLDSKSLNFTVEMLEKPEKI